jgi:serine protease Do
MFALTVLLSGIAQAAPNPALEQAMNATVMILRDDIDETFLGSGFYYGSDTTSGGLVLSNAHVVEEETTVILELRDGTRHMAKLVAKDVKRDFAVLRSEVARPGLTSASAPPDIGQPVYAIGAPLGIGFTVSRGIIAADPRQIDPTVPLRFLQHDAAINPGSSGGPLIDETGHLLGMNSQIADGSRMFVGIGYAISALDLDRLVPQLLARDLRPVAKLDMDARPVTKAIAKALDIPRVGLLIDDVAPDGLAGRAGIEPGDIIVAVDALPLTDPRDFVFLLEAASETALLDIRRGQETVTLRLPLYHEVTRDFPRPAPKPMPLRWSDLSVTTQSLNVTDLPETGPAVDAGLRVGDRILSANGQPIDTDPLAPDPDTALVLLVEREARHLHLIVDPDVAQDAPPPVIRGNTLDLSVRRF